MKGWLVRRWLRGKTRCPACGNGIRTRETSWIVSQPTTTVSGGGNITVTYTP